MPPTTTTTEPPTTTIEPPAPSCSDTSFSIDALLSQQRTLGFGSTGADVVDVQRMLQALALYDGDADGIYGQHTRAAVRSFQDARGLAIDGIVGSRTRGELASLHRAAQSGMVLAADGTLLRRGISGNTVRALQTILDLLGFSPGPIDGLFGPLTNDAVIHFQRDNSLTVDGIVGVQSRAALTQALSLYGLVICEG